MTIGLALALIAICLAFCMLAYYQTAIERNWPFGAIYTSDKANLVALVCLTSGVVKIGIYVAIGRYSSWALLLAVLAWVIGTPVIFHVLKQKTGPVALIGAPIAATALIFFRYRLSEQAILKNRCSEMFLALAH